jgi:hypothetical protein
VLGDEFGGAPVDRLTVGTGGAAALVHGHDEVFPEVARLIGEKGAGPDVAGDQHEPRGEAARVRSDPIGDLTDVLGPLVLGAVLPVVVCPAADSHLADVEGLAFHRLLVFDLARGAEVGDVGAHPVGEDDDVRHAAGQLAQDRRQVRLRRPFGDLLARCVDESLVENDRPVGGDDQCSPPERAGRTTLVAFQQPIPHRLHDRFRGARLGQPFGDAAHPQLQLGIGVLVGVGDIGADRGVRPGGREDRFQEGHVHDGRQLLGRAGTVFFRPRRLPTHHPATPRVGCGDRG